MKFARILGDASPPEIAHLVEEIQELLTVAFSELAINFSHRKFFSKLGGDALTYQLVCLRPHIADVNSIHIDRLEKELKEFRDQENAGKDVSADILKVQEAIKNIYVQSKGMVLRTAATNGDEFFWSPSFLKTLSPIGIRLVILHEATHSLYSHPNHRGSRNPGLWNSAIDFKVNYFALRDLYARGFYDPERLFRENLGDYITLYEYATFLKNPFKPPPKLAHQNPMHALKAMVNPGYSHPGKDAPPYFYVEPNLSTSMQRPEAIYEYLLRQIPKCAKCGKLGVYKKPEEYKRLEKELENK